MNLANKITLLRIVFVPVFIVFLILPIAYNNLIAALIFIVLNLADMLDGHVARRNNSVTDFGKVMDPVADKLLVAAALIFLIGSGIVPWMAFLIIARELLITGIRVIASIRKVIIPASFFGKAKTVLLAIGISAVLVDIDYLLSDWFGWSMNIVFGRSIAYTLMLIATFAAVYSGIDYFAKARSKGLME